jgi:hypothetical protein
MTKVVELSQTFKDITQEDVFGFFEFLQVQGIDASDEQQVVLFTAEMVGAVIKMYDIRLKRQPLIQDEDMEILTGAITRGHSLIQLAAGGH